MHVDNGALAGIDLSKYPAPTSMPQIKVGSAGDSTVFLRELLGASGFPAPGGGAFDAALREKVLAFQRSAGIGVDGIVGPQTWTALYRGVGGAVASGPLSVASAAGGGSLPIGVMGAAVAGLAWFFFLRK